MSITSLKPSAKAFDQRKRLLVVQVGVAFIAVLLLFTKPAILNGTVEHEIMETIGLSLVLICIAGRLWSILYVGGRKNNELISIGPFSMTQNPLYFFSTVGAAGVGLMFGSITVALLLGLLSYLIFRVTARKEAAYLLGKFGTAYRDYAERTPRFWPNPLLYHDQATWQFSPPALKKTFYDGLCFLALYPGIELIEYMRLGDFLPTLVTLY